MKRWVLYVLVFIGVISIVLSLSKNNEMNFFSKLFSQSEHSISKEEMAELIHNGTATLIDVRTPEEFKQGHIKGAKNFPLQNISQNLDSITKLQQPIIAVCRSGMRSGKATKMLNKNNIKTYNAGGWESFNNYLK